MDVLSKEKVSSQQTKYIFVILDITRNMTSSYLTSNLKGNKDCHLVLRRIKLKTRTAEQALEGRIVWNRTRGNGKVGYRVVVGTDLVRSEAVVVVYILQDHLHQSATGNVS